MIRRLVLLALAPLVLTLLSATPPATAAKAKPAHIAGWVMSSPDGRFTKICTSGFNVRNRKGHPLIATAGHCGTKGTEWYSHNRGYHLGTTTRRRFNPHRHSDDFAVVRVAKKHYRTPPKVEFRGGRLTVVRLGKPRKGMWVCTTGRTSGTRCGKILKVRPRFIDTSITTQPGDSGGPLYRRIPGTRKAAALGILTGSSGRSHFQRMDLIMRKYDLRLKTG